MAVADINQDGALELVVGDARGNLAAFNQLGKDVWERHLGSQINQASAALLFIDCVISWWTGMHIKCDSVSW